MHRLDTAVYKFWVLFNDPTKYIKNELFIFHECGGFVDACNELLLFMAEKNKAM